MRKETQCVHSGTLQDSIAGGINSPVFPSSAFNYLEGGDIPYPRYFNTPNQRPWSGKIASLEGAEDGVLFSSSMAAMSTAILAFAGTGDHVVMMDELYGGTHAFATDEFDRLGIAYSFAATNAEAICGAATERTKVIVIESPTNPFLGIIDHGVLATLLDATLGAAVISAIPREWWCATISLSVQFLEGAKEGCLRSSARVLRKGKKVAFSGGEIRDLECHPEEKNGENDTPAPDGHEDG